MFLTIFGICLFLGAIVGFLAGLLGIGGGLLIVPVLVYIFPLVGISFEQAMPMALATSLASIIVTSSAAALAHHKNQNVPWQIAKKIALIVGIGAVLGAFIAEQMSSQSLTYFFSGAVIVLASYMFLSIRVTSTRTMPQAPIFNLIGFTTGIIASLMGIAGGAILVPVLSYFGIALRQAIGIATVSGVAVALFGSAGFIYTGLQQPSLPEYSLGYIYLPAFLGMVITSSLFAKAGVNLAAKLPVKTLKRIFAIFLIVVAIKMLLS